MYAVCIGLSVSVFVFDRVFVFARVGERAFVVVVVLVLCVPFVSLLSLCASVSDSACMALSVSPLHVNKRTNALSLVSLSSPESVFISSSESPSLSVSVSLSLYPRVDCVRGRRGPVYESRIG